MFLHIFQDNLSKVVDSKEISISMNSFAILDRDLTKTTTPATQVTETFT